MGELKLFGPFGNLGYGGVSDEVWERTMEWKPDAIFQQGTSTDPGPGYLGKGESYADRAGVKHDLRKMLNAARRLRIPLLCSLGGGGSNAGLEWSLDIVDEIAREDNLKFTAAVISSEVDKQFIKGKLQKGVPVRALDGHPRLPDLLTPEMVDESCVIVAQMGPEPIMAAMAQGIDIVFTGRANDTSLPMALAMRNGFAKGISLQTAKVVECSGWAVLRDDHVLFPCLDLQKGSKSREKYGNISGVIAHGVFYERRDPLNPEYMPGGHLNIEKATWEQIDENTTKTSGGIWVDDPYTVKLEGAKMIGYRSICIAGMRDPFLISQVENGSYLKMAEQMARRKISDVGISPDDYQIHYKVYGLNGVMGALEPVKRITSHEICFVVDVLGKTPEVSKAVCMMARLQLLHTPYPGRITTAGNVAFPFSPSDMYVGETYVFNIWHLLPLEGEEKCGIFKMRTHKFPRI